MQIFVVLFVVAYANARSHTGIWKEIDIHDGFEVLKNLKPVGFEKRREVGDIDLYLVRIIIDGDGCPVYGRLFMSEDGSLYYTYQWYGGAYLHKITEKLTDKVEVLVTPPECLSWVPTETVYSLPSNPLFEEKCNKGLGGQKKVICRAWVEAKKSLYPGFMSLSSSLCAFPYDNGARGTETNLEVLAYNELSEVLPQCKI